MKKIQIGTSESGREFAAPIELVTQTTAIVGMRGSGKTNSATVWAEGMLAAGQQVVIIDPLDVWWGLRASGDGKADGFSVVILGGEHEDLPLESGGGRVLADFVTEYRASVVLSTRHLSKGKQRQLVAEFCEQLYERKGKTQFKTPLHVFIDEADAFAPQRLEGETARCFGAIDDLVRRGRSSGFGVTCITQRPAVLHKDILTQAEILAVHRIVSPQDRKAIEAWVEVHDAEGVASKVLSTLHTLPKGTAWIWSPGWLGVLEQVAVRWRSTFDSSYTPKIGEVQAGPRKLADVPLDALRAAMAATLEKAKAEDPAELRRQIADLRRQLAARPSTEREVEVPVVTSQQMATIGGILTWLDEVGKQIQELARQTIACRESVERLRGEIVGRSAPATKRTPPPSTAPLDTASDALAEGPTRVATGLSKPQQAILDALAWFESVGMGTVSRTNVAAMASVSPASSGFEKNLSTLHAQHEAISYPRAGLVSLTPKGQELANKTRAPMTLESLHTAWLKSPGLSEPQKALLRIIIPRRRAVSREELATLADVSASSSGFEKNVSRLSSLGLITYPQPGFVQVSELLFPLAFVGGGA